ncbi:MAG: autophagy protein 5 [Pycnora praestabilis]|nr:MAG: autophagy protein 5 [Pycnora praestabilis]
MTNTQDINTIQKAVWAGSLPLEIRLSPSDCRIQYPRLSYLPFLLDRLHAFYASSLINPEVPAHEGWFSFEGVPLKWHYPVGVLYDLFSGADPSSHKHTHKGADAVEALAVLELDNAAGHLPWRLVLHFTEWPEEQLVRLDVAGKVVEDAFINSVKEADFIRFGTAKGIMSLSKDDSNQLWEAVKAHDLPLFNAIHEKLLQRPGANLRNIPIKIYLPSSSPETIATDTGTTGTAAGSLKVVQSLITPTVSGKEPQTLGTALHNLLPSLFPHRRTPILARAVLHGAVLPLTAPVEEVMRGAAYADGWVHLGVVMMG